MLRILMQTCKNWKRKLATATMQNRTHIPLICSLCLFKSRMANVCKYKDHLSHVLFNKQYQLVKQNITSNWSMQTLTPRIWLNRTA